MIWFVAGLIIGFIAGMLASLSLALLVANENRLSSEWPMEAPAKPPSYKDAAQ